MALLLNGTDGVTFNDGSEQWAAASPYNFKNYLINGNFDVWQRGTSHNITNSQYTIDRWQLIFDGTPAGGGTVTRQTFTLGQTDVPNNPKYYLQYDFPSVGTPSNYIRQSIEGVHNLAGKVATFSFWAKVPSGTMTIGTQFQQEFGSGGSPSSGVYGIGSTNFTVTTSWQKFTMTTTLPSISGKTVGTNNNDKLNAAITFPGGPGTIHLAQAQVEAGDTATPFEVRPYDMEFQRCIRYFRTVGDGIIARVSSATVAYYSHHFETPMRATPVMSLAPSASVRFGNFYNVDHTATSPALLLPRASYNAVVGQINGFTGMTTADVLQSWQSSPPGWLFCDAEL